MQLRRNKWQKQAEYINNWMCSVSIFGDIMSVKGGHFSSSHVSDRCYIINTRRLYNWPYTATNVFFFSFFVGGGVTLLSCGEIKLRFYFLTFILDLLMWKHHPRYAHLYSLMQITPSTSMSFFQRSLSHSYISNDILPDEYLVKETLGAGHFHAKRSMSNRIQSQNISLWLSISGTICPKKVLMGWEGFVMNHAHCRTISLMYIIDGAIL